MSTKKLTNDVTAQLAGAVEYTDCFSAEELETSVLDMSQNNLMARLWEMWSTPSLPSLPDPLWPWMVVPDRVLSICQIELFDI